jgi:hypothetical protein
VRKKAINDAQAMFAAALLALGPQLLTVGGEPREATFANSHTRKR